MELSDVSLDKMLGFDMKYCTFIKQKSIAFSHSIIIYKSSVYMQSIYCVLSYLMIYGKTSAINISQTFTDSEQDLKEYL